MVLAGAFCLAVSTKAATFIRANNSNKNLNVKQAWTANSSTPGGADVAQWDSTFHTSGGENISLGSNQVWGEIKIINPGLDITIPDFTLTLNGISGIGIDMSSASKNLTLNCNLILGGAQSWTVASGQLLTIGGNVSNGANLLTVNGGGNTLISGAIGNGSGGLTKSGSGVLTLTGNNTYSGNTIVSVGTLALSTSGNNNIGSSSQILVGDTAAHSSAILNVTGVSGSGGFKLQSGQTLAGFGTVNGSVTVLSGGTLNPGTVGTVGTLALGATTFNSGSAFSVDLGLGAANVDKLIINGAATINSGAAISFNQLSTPDQGKYVLATATSGLNSAPFTGTVPTNYRLLASSTELDLQHTATISLALGANAANVHVGSQTVNLTIGNTAPTGSADLSYTLGGVTGSGTRTAQSTSPATGTYTAVAGANSFNITASDSNAGNSPQSVAFSQTGYNLAAAAASQTINVGNTHVGVAKTAAVTLNNTAPVNATYTETLSSGAFSGTTSGFTTGGSVSGIVGGGSGSGTLLIGLGASLTAGAQSGQTTLALNSDAVNGSGLGTTLLSSQTITITGGVYNYAVANTITSPINLGNIRVGGSFGTQTLAITNTAPSGAFTEGLDASLGALTGDASKNAGTISNLAGGSGNTSSLSVGLGAASTTVAGAKSGTVQVLLTSDGANSGLANTLLTPQTLTVNGNVYRLATVNTLGDVSLGNIRVGGSFGTQALSIQNTAATDGFSEKLNVTSTSTTPDASVSGSFGGLLASGGASSGLSVGLSGSGSAGHKTGTVTLNFASDGTGTSGFSALGIGNQQITVSGNAYDFANATYTGGVLNFGNVHVGAAGVTQSLAIKNSVITSAAYQDKLNATPTTDNGNVTGTGFSGLGAGAAAQNVVLSANTSSAGSLASTVSLGLYSAPTASGLTGQNITGTPAVTTTGAVWDYASPSFGSTTINLGNVHAGSAFTSQALSLSNASGAYREASAASFGTPAAGITASGSIAGLAAGANDNSSLLVGMSDTSAGNKSGTVQVNLTSLAGGAGLTDTTLTPQTINVSGTVYDYASPSFASTTINLGNVHTGGAFATQTLSLSNASGGFREALAAGFGSATGGVTGNGSISSLAAGATDNTSLQVGGLSAVSAGAQSGTIQVGLTSKAGGVGLNDTTLTPQTINVSGTVYDYASPSFTSTTINLGNVHAGSAFTSQALSLSNAGGAYQEALAAGFGSATGGATGSGSITSLAAGATDHSTLLVGGLNTGTSGSKIGTVQVNLTSKAGGAGLTDTTLTPQTINVSGTVYDLASPNFTATTINLGSIHAGGTFGTQALSLSNADGPYREALDAGFGSPSAGITATGSMTGLAAGASDNSSLAVGISDNTAGNKSGTVQVSLASNGTGTSGLGNTALASQIITVQGTVYSGQGVWNTNGNGSWSDVSKWTAAGGVPGVDGALSAFDSALFGSALTSGHATVSLNGTSPTLANLTFDNATRSYTLAQGSGGSLVLNGAATVVVNAGDHGISAPITGSGASLTMSGSGGLTLSGNNTYDGGTTVSAGQLTLGNANALGSGGLTVNGGTVELNGISLALPNLSGSGGTIQNTVNPLATLTVGADNSSTAFSGGLTDAGNGNKKLALVKTGTGTLTLNGSVANSYSGVTTVDAGVLQLGKTAGVNAISGDLVIGDGAGGVDADIVKLLASNQIVDTALVTVNSSGEFDLNGFNETVTALSGSGNVVLNGGNLTVLNDAGGSFSGDLSGNGGFTKGGNGAYTIHGTHGYHGATVVQAGKLVLDGSIANSAVTVDAGAVLAGNGVVGSISGAGNISPGNSPGYLEAASVDGSSSLSFSFELTQLGSPSYASATIANPALIANDVVRLTDLTAPFTNPFTSANVIDVYFDLPINAGDVYRGGFYTDLSSSFLASISGATFHYYVLNPSGSVTYNGNTYSLLSSSFTVAVNTVLDPATFNIGMTGTFSGFVTQFAINPSLLEPGAVPEPGVLTLLLVGGLVMLGRKNKKG